MSVVPISGVFATSMLILPGDGFGGTSPTTPGASSVYMLPGLGTPTERVAETTSFNSTADAIAFAFTGESGSIVLDGNTPAQAPRASDSNGAASIVPNVQINPVYGQSTALFDLSQQVGGITEVVAICDGNSSGSATLQLWYVKNFTTGGGFTAGQAFDMTEGGVDILSGATYNGKYRTGIDMTSFSYLTGGFAGAALYPHRIGRVASTSCSTNIITVNLQTTLPPVTNIHAGVTVYFSGLTVSTFLNGKYATVLTATPATGSPVTSFTIYFSHADYGTTGEGSTSGVTGIGWYPDYGDMVVATLSCTNATTIFNLSLRTTWQDHD